jgi:hypothetical protein
VRLAVLAVPDLDRANSEPPFLCTQRHPSLQGLSYTYRVHLTGRGAVGVQETFVKLGGRRVLPYFRFQRLLIGTARYDHTAICVQTGVSHTQPSECGSKRACISDTCVQSGVSDTVVMAAAGRAVRVHVPGERTAAHRQLVWRLLRDAPLLCERYGHTPPCKALRCVCRAYLTGRGVRISTPFSCEIRSVYERVACIRTLLPVRYTRCIHTAYLTHRR